MTIWIVPALAGGIGNRLFQIAAANHVASRVGHPLAICSTYVDVNLHGEDPDNAWYLRRIPVLTLEPDFVAVPVDEVWGEPPSALIARVSAALAQVESTASQIVVIIRGYFQSEDFFNSPDEAATIREWFTWPEPIPQMDLQEADSYAIHVRRTDYVDHPGHELLTSHAGLSPYYTEAMGRFPLDAHGVVFSDDIEWCRQYLSDRDLRFGDGSIGCFNSLQLMSRCRVGIVTANSSFSWWAAWLNPNPNKLVVMPSRWFGGAHGMPTNITGFFRLASYTPVVVDV